MSVGSPVVAECCLHDQWRLTLQTGVSVWCYCYQQTVTICVVISVAASCYQLITRIPFVNLTLIVALETAHTPHRPQHQDFQLYGAEFNMNHSFSLIYVVRVMSKII